MMRHSLMILSLLVACDPSMDAAEISQEPQDTTLRAPCPGSPYASIQAAIDATPPSGGSIRVCDGVFNERLTVRGKFIDLRSMNGAAVTVLDAGSGGTGLTVTDGGHLVVVGFTVRNGRRTTGSGGAVSCADSTLAITESRLENNRAYAGGAVAAYSCKVDVYDTEFVGNTATEKGGAIYANGTSSGRVRESIFASNTAPRGGGVYVSGAVVVDYNEFEGNSAGMGGAAYLKGSSAFAWNDVTENTATIDGGGLYLDAYGGSAYDNWFFRNVATKDGGAIFAVGGNGKLNTNSFHENHADDDAGAVRLHDSTLSVYSSSFVRNTAASEGGAMKVSLRPASIRSSMFVDNSSGEAGGAMALDESASTLQFNRFEGNESQSGGALYVVGGWASPQVLDGSFIDNSATLAGGHAWLTDMPTYAVTTFTRVTFDGGTAERGGAVAAEWAPVQVYNSVFDGNIATRSGGALHLHGANGGVMNSVAYANAAPEGAAVTIVDAQGLRMRNSAWVDNVGGSAVRLASGSWPSWKYNDMYGNTSRFSGMADPSGRDGNLTAAPGFVDGSAGDFHLLEGSPLIDAGDPAISDPDGTRSDIGRFGGPRQ